MEWHRIWQSGENSGCIAKKENSFEWKWGKKALKIQQSQDIMNADKDEHFSVRDFFLPHDTSLAEKFVLYRSILAVVQSKMPIGLCSASSYCSAGLPSFYIHVSTIL